MYDYQFFPFRGIERPAIFVAQYFYPLLVFVLQSVHTYPEQFSIQKTRAISNFSSQGTRIFSKAKTLKKEMSVIGLLRQKKKKFFLD